MPTPKSSGASLAIQPAIQAYSTSVSTLFDTSFGVLSTLTVVVLLLRINRRLRNGRKIWAEKIATSSASELEGSFLKRSLTLLFRWIGLKRRWIQSFPRAKTRPHFTLGVDVARYGDDDTVTAPKNGRASAFRLGTFTDMVTNMQVAAETSNLNMRRTYAIRIQNRHQFRRGCNRTRVRAW